jgi:spore coat protein U-like protein
VKIWLSTLGALLFLTWSASSHAMSCTVSSLGVALGSYDSILRNQQDSNGTLTYRCDDVSTDIIIQLSSGSSGSYFPRRMSQGPFRLSYNLYRDGARTLVWGDGSAGTTQLGPFTPASGIDTDVTVYGRIPANQNVHAGPFSDTIVVTVVF